MIKAFKSPYRKTWVLTWILGCSEATFHPALESLGFHLTIKKVSLPEIQASGIPRDLQKNNLEVQHFFQWWWWGGSWGVGKESSDFISLKSLAPHSRTRSRIVLHNQKPTLVTFPKQHFVLKGDLRFNLWKCQKTSTNFKNSNSNANWVSNQNRPNKQNSRTRWLLWWISTKLLKKT